MLVLTRKIEEKLIINDNIKVIVLDVKGNQVRIGFEAPDDILVYREEIYERIKEQQANEDKKDSAS